MTKHSAVATAEIGHKLIYMDDAKKAVALAISTGLGCLLYGEGGHAKTELGTEIALGFAGQATSGVMSLNANTNPIDILGGLSSDAVREFRYDRPRVEESVFGRFDIVQLEEVFDAPPRVLTVLKDVMTSRAWRHGDECVPLRFRTIIAMTNHDPKEVAKVNPSVAALIERFPLQVRVMWKSYAPDDYALMFASLDGSDMGGWAIPSWETLVNLVPASMTEGVLTFLCVYLAEVGALGFKISPRTAVYARKILCAWAKLSGSETVEKEHFDILRLLCDLRDFHDEAMKKAEHRFKLEADKAFLKLSTDEFNSTRKSVKAIVDRAQSAGAATKVSWTEEERELALTTAKSLAKLRATIANHKWQDEAFDSHRELQGNIDTFGHTMLAIAGLRAKE